MPITVHTGSEVTYLLAGRYSNPARIMTRAARTDLLAITWFPSEGNQDGEFANGSHPAKVAPPGSRRRSRRTQRSGASRWLHLQSLPRARAVSVRRRLCA